MEAKDYNYYVYTCQICQKYYYLYFKNPQTVTLAAIKEDQELQQFFKDLVSNYLYTGGDLARIDILSCPVEQIQEGKQLIKVLSELIGVPVYASEVSIILCYSLYRYNI